ncbi:MAG: nitrogen fixation protein NifZ [Pseudomonadota bacterium]
MTLPTYEYGDEVRVIRNIRNDGTFAGEKTGNLLVRRGSVGFVRNRGTFLQDQIIYEVHFVDQGRVVGCREEELIGAQEEWVPSQFEFREKVKSKKMLLVRGELIADIGDVGEIIKVLRHHEGGVAYHVRFPGHTLVVPEASLATAVPHDAGQ